MSNVRTMKRGEILFKESDKIQTIFIIQSGQISIQFLKNKKSIEIMTASAGYVFAEQIVLAATNYNYTAIATQETKIVEIPIDAFKLQYESCHQIYRSFIKTCCERLKWSMLEIKNKKSDKDLVSCGPEEIPRIFGIVFHTMKHKGTMDSSASRIDWMTFRQYAQRIFGETLKRTEQVTQIMVKLKLGEYIMTPKDEDDVLSKPEIAAFKIFDLNALESFYEFYQYYYYKGNKQNILKPDEVNFNILRILLMAFDKSEPDKAQIVSRDLNEVIDFFKQYGISFGSGQLSALESIGLFCKRKAIANNQVVLQFELKEFQSLFNSWRIIREIDKWNERNSVDIYEIDEGPKKKIISESGIKCGHCKHIAMSPAKFCSECGQRIDNSGTLDIEKKSA